MDEKVQWSEEKFQRIMTLQLLSIIVWLLGILFYHLPLALSSAALARSETEQLFVPNAASILGAAVVALFLLYLLRRVKAVGLVVSMLLGILIYRTLWLFIEPLVAVLISVLLVYLNRAYRSFWSNNIFLCLAVFAGAVPFAVFYKADFLLILLLLFAAYDIFGVLFTKVIPKAAMGAIAQGTPLLLLAPKLTARWRDQPSLENTAAAMGAGDLFLPLLFLSAVSTQFGIARAIACFFGAVVGNGLNMFFLRRMKRGIPAMPLLAAGMAVGYVLVKG